VGKQLSGKKKLSTDGVADCTRLEVKVTSGDAAAVTT